MKTKILGLTGSIGMGKTTTSNLFKYIGVPVFDADASVHKILSKDRDIIEKINQIFPNVIVNGKIDRKALGDQVFDNLDHIKKLESIIHPIVRNKRSLFIRKMNRFRYPLVLLDIPLLFESKTEQLCDYVAVVTSPFFLQRDRVLKRDGMSAEKFIKILNRQIPDKIKKKKADFIIFSSLGKYQTLRTVKSIKKKIITYDR